MRNDRMILPMSLLLSCLLLLPVSGIAESDERPSAGKLQVLVIDPEGIFVSESHVYIYGGNPKQLIDAQDADGEATFNLPPGKYHVYSGITRKMGDHVDHYASHEATVQVPADDSASVILTLYKMQDSILYLSDSARKRLGIDDELANNLN